MMVTEEMITGVAWLGSCAMVTIKNQIGIERAFLKAVDGDDEHFDMMQTGNLGTPFDFEIAKLIMEKYGFKRPFLPKNPNKPHTVKSVHTSNE